MMERRGLSTTRVCGLVLLLLLFASITCDNFDESQNVTIESTAFAGRAAEATIDKESTVPGHGAFRLEPQKVTTRLSTKSSTVDEKTNGNAVSDDFTLAFRESLGFFTDIPAHEWQMLKTISKDRVHHANGNSYPVKQTYYQRNWDPDFSCRFENSIGQTEGDGHKWVCDPHRLADKKGCLIYSIGSNGQFEFEVDLQRLLPNCEIHIFDPTDYSQAMSEQGLNGANYHAWGLEPSYGKPVKRSRRFKKLKFMSLRKTMDLLGHKGRRIDVLKIDCEGCEWAALKDFFDQDIRQILVEVHGVNDMTEQFFNDFHDEGFAIFHKEANLYAYGACMEFAFLKLSKEYYLN
jgi:Methyltransferase domain